MVHGSFNCIPHTGMHPEPAESSQNTQILYIFKIRSSYPKSVQNYTLIFFLKKPTLPKKRKIQNIKPTYGIINTVV